MPPHGRMRNMNMSQFSVPSVSLCESFHCAPSTSFSWCSVETMATTPALSIKMARCNISETQKQMAKKNKTKVGRKKGKKESLCLWLYVPFSSFLLFALVFVWLPVVMGSFEEGERSQSVSQGEGAVVPAPRIRSFPQPQVTWFRDGRKIPPSSRM